MADALEEKLQGLFGEAFEDSIGAKISSFGGLLTRRAAIRLLCKERGIGTERKVVLSEAASEPLPFSFSGRVDRIFPVQNFSSGERCVRLHLSDKAGGQGTLVLWGSQASLVEGWVSTGDEIECKGAYFRSGEIHLGRESRVEHAKKFPITQVGELTAGPCSVEGVVREVFLDYEYVDRKTGAEKKMGSYLLCNPEGKDCRRVAVWSAPEGTPRVAEGDTVLLENVLFRNGELHFNSFSRMVRRFSAQEKSGAMEGVEIQDGTAVFSVGGGRFACSVGEALALLGVSRVPEGVEPSTMLSIKGESIAGKRARFAVSGGKIAWLKIEQG